MENKKINIIPAPSVMAERDEVLAKAYKDLIFFGRVFLPQDFLHKSESPQFHYDLWVRVFYLRLLLCISFYLLKQIDRTL